MSTVAADLFSEVGEVQWAADRPASNSHHPPRVMPFSIESVVGPEECEHACRSIDALREHWTPRTGHSMWTVGAAAYLDCPDPEVTRGYGNHVTERLDYATDALRLNRILVESFSDLYTRVAVALAEAFGTRVGYLEKFARPGFHIFLDAPEFALQANHIPHFDRPFAVLDFGPLGKILDFEKTLSFTLALELPQAGGGLKTWDVSYSDVRAVPREEARAAVKSAKLTIHPYHCGGMICQTGNEMHQIQPWSAYKGERRVTLQGHGFFVEESLLLYW